MLEIPESRTLARQLKETVQGKKVTAVEANHSPHGFAFYTGDPAGYPKLLLGKTVSGANAWAGQSELELEDARLLFNDGVNVRYLPAGAKPPLKHQLYVGFEDGSALVCTVQMYGGMQAFRDGENENFYYLVAKEKPSPLSDGFDRRYFEGILSQAKPNLSAKALLATEQRIPGLGNGCLQDILFCASVHPKTRLCDLKDSDFDRLFHAVKDKLREMAEKGGRDTEKDLFGKQCGYRTLLSKNTIKDPCPVCGGGLVRQAYLGGNVYFCPACQPLPKAAAGKRR